MKYSIDLSHILNKYFKNEHFRRALFTALVIFLFVSLFFIFDRSTAQRPTQNPVPETSITLLSSAQPTITPTKWWIRKTATANPVPAVPSTSASGEEQSAIICSDGFASTLMSDSYAYISTSPPFPNRIRSSASLASDYLGQIEPGEGVLILDGPACANGFSWWLIESLDHKLRGWSVEGDADEQWMLPCPSPRVACRQVIHATPTRPPMPVQPSQTNPCTSAQFSIGEFAQVGKDSLLILRSEPDTGDIIGRAGPMSIVNFIDGPDCSSQTVWWRLIVTESGLEGWAAEDNLNACQQEDNGCYTE
jgi:hypothetical protein